MKKQIISIILLLFASIGVSRAAIVFSPSTIIIGKQISAANGGNVSGLAPGVYFVEVSISNQTFIANYSIGINGTVVNSKASQGIATITLSGSNQIGYSFLLDLILRYAMSLQ